MAGRSGRAGAVLVRTNRERSIPAKDRASAGCRLHTQRNGEQSDRCLGRMFSDLLELLRRRENPDGILT